MSAFTRPWLGWSLCVAALALGAAAPLVAVSNDMGLAWVLPSIAPLVGCAVVGLLLALRVPGNAIGWLFLVTALIVGLGKFGDAYAGTTPVPFAAGAAVVAAGVFEPLVLFVLPALLLLFPDGRLPARRWRPLAWLLVAAVLAFVIGQALSPGGSTLDSGRVEANPIGLTGTAGAVAGDVGFASTIIMFLGMAAAAVSLIVRFRRADGALRQQLKWVGAAATVLAVVVVCLPVSWVLGVPNTAVSALLALAGTGLVAATGVAILRHRLYEIDVIIRRTLVYATLALALTAVYLAGITLATALFRSLTGQSGAVTVTISTLAVAAVFQPLRSRIQRGVDRRFYRGKYDSVHTLQAFNAHLRGQFDVDALASAVIAVVGETVQPSQASLWLRPRSLN